MMRRLGRIAVSLVLFFSIAQLAAEIQLEPFEWNLETIQTDTIVTLSLRMVNTGESPVRFRLSPDCGCVYVEPGQGTIPPQSETEILLTYDSAEQQGPQQKYLILRTDDPGLPKGLFSIFGTVQADGSDSPTEISEAPVLNGEPGSEELQFFYSPGCGECHEFLTRTFPEAAKASGYPLGLSKYDILDAEVFEMMEGILKDRGTVFHSVPVLVGPGFVLQGFDALGTDLVSALTQAAETDLERSPEQATDSGRPDVPALSLAPIILAGLLDGINPCAFTAIIFLLTSLTAFGRRRNEVLIIGLTFTVSVFITYYAAGLGIFQAIRLFSGFYWVRNGLRWILACGLLVLVFFSVRDAWYCARGRSSEMTLQMPGAVKRKMRSTIKGYARSTALVGGALVLGAMVSLFELACTGQVYLPMLTWMVQTGRNGSAFGFLAVYNLAFILPLTAVFIASWIGIGSSRIIQLYQKHIVKVKVGIAVLFFGLALYLVI